MEGISESNSNVTNSLPSSTEKVPPSALVIDLHSGDDPGAPIPLDAGPVTQLAASTGVEGAAVQRDRTRTRVDDGGLVAQQIRVFVTEVDGHGSNATPAGSSSHEAQRDPEYHRVGATRRYRSEMAGVDRVLRVVAAEHDAVAIDRLDPLHDPSAAVGVRGAPDLSGSGPEPTDRDESLPVAERGLHGAIGDEEAPKR